ncbi:MAG: cytochrome c biogenesis protein ResB [Cyanobacteria bacterium SZAS LIN-3]|nr:cytochrome c biogenesis protein ResB [Cyanobacteria bacterium SZAS LIN-3]
MTTLTHDTDTDNTIDGGDNDSQAEAVPAAEPAAKAKTRDQISPFASVQFSVFLMVLLAATVLLGAWCPQEPAVGQEKVFEAFDRSTAEFLVRTGVTDIFHSPWFLFLIAMLSFNMIVVSCQRVFPKVRQLKNKMPFLGVREIDRLPYKNRLVAADKNARAALLADFSSSLTKMGYKVELEGERLRAEYGKYGRLAASVTHVGLLSLLLGVTITSWTGFNGFEPVLLDENLTFDGAKRAKLWVGKIPKWHVRVDATRRENYPSGEAKQWYSTLTVVSPEGKELTKKEISVNEPLSYESVDVYQSSWGLDKLAVSFNGHQVVLPLRSMGNRYAAFLPLTKDDIMILSLTSEANKLRVFAKRPEWQAPKLISELPLGQSLNMDGVRMTFDKVIPITGLQYKCDPGLPVTYFAFAVIMLGVSLAAIPHRHVWAAFDDSGADSALLFGGTSRKARVGFERSMDKVAARLGATANAKQSLDAKENSTVIEQATVSGTETGANGSS